MSTRRKCIAIAAVMLLFGVMLAGYGCKKTESEVQAADSIALCIKCGQIKGDALCCKPDQTACTGCGLVKGSIGCCKIPKGATEAAICTKCGQIKGTDVCCKPGQTTCDKCGLVKGAPGCCKLPAK